MRAFKPRRRVNGKTVVAESYSGSYRMDWMKSKSTVALKTTDKTIAERHLRDYCKMLELRHEGLPIPSGLWGAPTLDLVELTEDYAKALASKRRSEKHIHDTVRRIRVTAEACGWETVEDVTAASFEKWRSGDLIGEKTGKPLSVKCVNEHLVSLQAFLNWLKRLGHIEKNVLAYVEKGETRGHETKRRRVWTLEELTLFMEKGKPLKRADYRIAIWLLHWTGLRKEELATLRWGDVFLDKLDPHVIIRAENSKNHKTERVPLMAKVATKLQEIRPEGAETVDPVLTFAIPGTDQFKRDQERVGLVYSNEFGDLDFHSLRHTFGYILAINGVPLTTIQQILRHKHYSTTKRHYLKVQQLLQPQSLKDLFGSESFTPETAPEADFSGPKLS